MPDLILTEEEQMLQSTLRDFVDKEIAPKAKEWTKKANSSGKTGAVWLILD